MQIGEKIFAVRKRRNMTQGQLGAAIGLSQNAVSMIESDQVKAGPDPHTLIRIAEALGDNEILLHYLESNPVFQAIIPRIFPELNNIKTDPAIVFSRFADEAEEAARSARALSQLFAHANPRSLPDFSAMFIRHMEQIVDIQRCAEILMTTLVAAQVMTESDRIDLHARQQAKCEAKGHHIKDQAA